MVEVLPTQYQAGGQARSDCCTTDLAYTIRSVVSAGLLTLHGQYLIIPLTGYPLDVSFKFLLERKVE